MDDDENACVRNIVKEIIRECTSTKINVNKNFVTYLTKLLLINPNWGIGDDFFSQRQNVQHFVKHIIEELLRKQDSPTLVTLKIQFYFSCNLENMDYVIAMNRRDLRHRLVTLKDDMYTISKANSKEEIDTLFRKLVYYITLASGLGNPTKPKVYEEALIALKSILDDAELKEFAAMPKHEKNIKLEECIKVVAGIRLFNKDCEKGGEGIANLPDLLNKAIEVIREGTEQALLFIMEKVNTLTTVVDECYIMRQTYRGFQMQFLLSDDLAKLSFDIEYFKDLLIFFRQYELLIRRILEELDRIHDKAEIIFANMVKMLKTIHDTVYMKIAIPVGIVFPLFEQLCDIWEQFQNQALLLSRLSVIMSNLETYSRQPHVDHVMLEHFIGDNLAMTDADRLARTAHLRLSSDNQEIDVIKTETIKNIDNIKLEYLGFCCWKLIETNGALIPGNPSMGIAIYKGKNYVFSSAAGFKQFAKDPQMYINSILDLSRRKPQLINFFQLKEELESVYHIGKLVQSKVEIRMCEDKVVQTVSNDEESQIDPEHYWNIWDLKRRALTMANISSAKTQSTQTYKTGSNNCIRSQTYSTKEVEVQTMREEYTNVPKPFVFIYGLRGRKDDKQFKLDLTKSVNDS